jgi:hypothetical protein
MRVVIDRFEGDYAVCEKSDRTMVTIERKRLPKGVKEGDVLIIDGDIVRFDESETKHRKEQVKKLMDELWK